MRCTTLRVEQEQTASVGDKEEEWVVLMVVVVQLLTEVNVCVYVCVFDGGCVF